MKRAIVRKGEQQREKENSNVKESKTQAEGEKRKWGPS
jgi:hypothetical protein